MRIQAKKTHLRYSWNQKMILIAFDWSWTLKMIELSILQSDHISINIAKSLLYNNIIYILFAFHYCQDPI